MNNTTKEHIYLAALLHDIGKFYQRADHGSVEKSTFLSQQNKEQRIFLPNKNGLYTHKHCLWTAQFIDDFRPVFSRLIGNDLNDLCNKNNLINIAACHHLSYDQLSEYGKIIKEADSLSSGMDRDSEESIKDDQDEKGWDAFKRKRMTSIFQDILSSNQDETKRYHIPLNEISLSKASFPKLSFTDDPDYSTLWGKFIRDFKFIQANTYHAFSETLLSLLYKYTTSIPASTINFPDVSLYDHLKTTAALAVCLYDLSTNELNDTNYPFLLIGADFSGIQNYIYQIVSSHASKNLKGRSFYLKILSDSIVRYILSHLELYQANVIYNSGGSFYILAPNTKKTISELSSIIKKIEKHMFDSHGLSLYVAIDYVPFSKDVLFHKKGYLNDVWKKLFELREKKKKTKFLSLIENQNDFFFIPQQNRTDLGCDRITGEEFLQNEDPYNNNTIELSPIKRTTGQQIVLGRFLRDADVLVISEEEIPDWKGKNPINPAQFGYYYYLLKRGDLTKVKEKLHYYADKVSVISLNGDCLNCDFLNRIDEVNNIYGLDFYGGNSFSEKTFEEMCENDNLNRLGILRMDVDNLGFIFQKGIAPHRATLSRYASLSRSFDYFFSGYLNRIQQDIDKEHTFIIYSGGDDLFIIGNWISIIKIAKQIHSDFKEFTCKNKVFSISGGISILPPKFPIMKGAEYCSEEEGRAKTHSNGDSLKNSISFLQIPMNWESEFPAVEHLKEKLFNLCQKEKSLLPRSFLSKMMMFLLNADIAKDDKGYYQIKNLKIYWMMAYDLSRMKERCHSAEAKETIDICIKECCIQRSTLNNESIKTLYHPIILWALACRWTELELRMYNK